MILMKCKRLFMTRKNFKSRRKKKVYQKRRALWRGIVAFIVMSLFFSWSALAQEVKKEEGEEKVQEEEIEEVLEKEYEKKESISEELGEGTIPLEQEKLTEKQEEEKEEIVKEKNISSISEGLENETFGKEQEGEISEDILLEEIIAEEENNEEQQTEEEKEKKEYFIRFNEFQITGGTGKTKEEFIELYNFGESDVDIEDWYIRKYTSQEKFNTLSQEDVCEKKNSSSLVTLSTKTVKKGSYYVLVNSSSSEDLLSLADQTWAKSNSISPGNILILCDDLEALVDTVYFENPGDAYFMAYKEDSQKWLWVNIFSPGEKNIFSEEEDEGEEGGSEKEDDIFPKIRLNELFPDPVKVPDTEGEFIELFNEADELVSLDGWILRDASGKERNLSGIIAGGGFFVEYGKITLNNTDEFLQLFSPQGEKVDEISYTQSEPGKTLSRFAGGWQWVCTPTPGAPNANSGFLGPTTLRISEILPDPGEGQEEFIELYNYGSEPVRLYDWILGDAVKDIVLNEKHVQEYLNPFSYGALPVSRLKLALNNTKEQAVLKDPCGKIQDEFFYETSQKGKSWSYDGKEWKETPYVTQGEENRFPVSAQEREIRINEVLPNPSGNEEEKEYIELYVFGEKPIDISYWELSDATSKSYTFPQGTLLSPGSHVTIYRSEFGFSLNNSQDEIFLRDALGEEIDSLHYSSAKEDISWNYSDGGWRKSGYLTPGKENKLNHLPKFEDVSFPEKVYTNVKASFSGKGKDKDGDALSYRWEFGDERKSYKEETTHVYTKKGTYLVRFRLSDEIEEVYKEKEIKVQNYPDYEISITALLPNPEGKDSEGEWIEIKNHENEKIALFGWSIATGRDKDHLVNHLIREEIILEKNTSQKIYRKQSSFSLRNTSGVVELRSPDKTVVDRIEYKKESIQEGELYTSGEGIWSWVLPMEEGFYQVGVTQGKGEKSFRLTPEVLGVMSEGERDVYAIFQRFSWEWNYEGRGHRKLEKKNSRYLFTRRGIFSDRPWWARCLWGKCRGW